MKVRQQSSHQVDYTIELSAEQNSISLFPKLRIRGSELKIFNIAKHFQLKMRSQSLSLLAVAVSCASAMPSQIAKRDWVGDNKGNLKISFSDDTIKLGTVGIDDIINNLYTTCSTAGTCDTGDVALNGQLISSGLGGEIQDITITIHPDGAYPTWIHNALLDALSAAVKAVAQCADVTNSPTCPTTMAYCPSEPFTVNECVVPRYWSVNYQPSDLNGAPPFIQADMTFETDDIGFCDTLVTVGGAVAGAVNGAAGGIFSLIGLFCKK
ncbi:hypothetical protein HD806DRAFT_543494 [Xylariaceae sp. AK1471]|nr:hypothetical protein HD806DRAFT_543494 [Xylariaceae sp. AK1471]